MNKTELKQLLFDNLVYQHDEFGLVYDYCNDCSQPVIQIDLGQGSFGCEYCGSENISNCIKVEK